MMRTKRFIAAFLTVITMLSTLVINVSADTLNSGEGINGFVKRMYSVCLDREPDESGLKYWNDMLINKEATGCSVACGFVYSPEFQNKKCTNEQYVTYMYSAFFGRDPEKDGFEYWVTSLNNGMTRDAVFSGFTNSKEFGELCDSYGVIRGCFIQGFDIDKTVKVNLFVERLYNVVLDRSCDNDGMTYWTLQLVNRENTGAGVASGFVFSPEFINKNYCDKHYVEMLYASFMGRTPDESGISYWCSVLESGDSRENVFNGFACSEEFNGICASYGIESGSISVSGSGTHANGNCAMCATTKPTKTPTAVPTAKPTTKPAAPTKAPTAKPTTAPTVAPTKVPTKAPTKAPTSKPTVAPTTKPTVAPTKAPVVTPTKAPVAPTAKPTSVPTIKPTVAPTANPTVAPTVAPTKVPTKAPTATPTAIPTPKIGLVVENGDYYYYNSNGSKSTGWVNLNGTYYYFDSFTQKAVKEWQFIGGTWYYFDASNCKMQTGYLTHNGKMYFLNDDGSMHTGWKQSDSIGKDWYYFDPIDGYAHTGWVKDGSNYYYLKPQDYKMLNGWLEYNGVWYYLSLVDGRMLSGSLLQQYGDGPVKIYYFDESGAMVTGWKQVNGHWYYFQDYGEAYVSGEYKIGGDYYYFNSEGIMLANAYGNGHYYGSSGARVY